MRHKPELTADFTPTTPRVMQTGPNVNTMRSAVWPALLLVAFFSACSTDTVSTSEDPWPERCGSLCTRSACDGATELSTTAVEHCQASCLAKAQETFDLSDACADSYESSVECVSALACEAFKAWEVGEKPAACEAPLDDFAAACEGITFTFAE